MLYRPLRHDARGQFASQCLRAHGAALPADLLRPLHLQRIYLYPVAFRRRFAPFHYDEEPAVGIAARMGRSRDADAVSYTHLRAHETKAQHDLFVGGRFLGEIVPRGDNPRREIPNYETTPEVLAAEWESRSGRRACVVVNMGDTARGVELPDGRRITVPALDAIRIDR